MSGALGDLGPACGLARTLLFSYLLICCLVGSPSTSTSTCSAGGCFSSSTVGIALTISRLLNDDVVLDVKLVVHVHDVDLDTLTVSFGRADAAVLAIRRHARPVTGRCWLSSFVASGHNSLNLEILVVTATVTTFLSVKVTRDAAIGLRLDRLSWVLGATRSRGSKTSAITAAAAAWL